MKNVSARIIDLPKIFDNQGNFSIIEEFKNTHFKRERAYWIYDVPGGEKRGGHACKENQAFFVALSGSFDVILDNGKEKNVYSLNLIMAFMFCEMNSFSTNS